MKSNHKDYNFEDSLGRIDEILNANSKNYEELKYIPNRDKLTFTNGFYVQCTAVFVDIRDSSKMTDQHRRSVLAKIYRSFISETIAIFNGNSTCREVSIQGDCVWAVFNTLNKEELRLVLSSCAQVNSLIDVLNIKFNRKGYQRIDVGIGVDYGRALMIKAGYKGSSINDVIWMGDVVNQACHLSSYKDAHIMISSIVYDNLENIQYEKWRDWFTKKAGKDYYFGNIINVEMNDWIKHYK
jgi:hypothetical protein|nr:adenylate/guanylate cyclase domain-containing protein [uncultured Capnocytophaga sp.]